MRLTALRIGGEVESWRSLGFDVQDGRLMLGGVTIELTGERAGISAWAVEGLSEEIEGLPTFDPPEESGPSDHSNGAIGIDQVVVLTPDFDRTAQQLDEHGMPLRRIRDAGGFRQGFRRLGPAILELVEAAREDRRGLARFWGLVVIVPDLEELKEQLGDLLGTPTRAVQAGRQIVTVRKNAGLRTRVAFMTPER